MWFKVLNFLLDILLARHYFGGSILVSPKDNVIYQLHGFSDASNSANGSVVYLHRILNSLAMVAIVFDRKKKGLEESTFLAYCTKRFASCRYYCRVVKTGVECFRTTGVQVVFLV